MGKYKAKNWEKFLLEMKVQAEQNMDYYHRAMDAYQKFVKRNYETAEFILIRRFIADLYNYNYFIGRNAKFAQDFYKSKEGQVEGDSYFEFLIEEMTKNARCYDEYKEDEKLSGLFNHYIADLIEPSEAEKGAGCDQ